MMTSSIAISNGAVKCSSVTPLVRDKAVFSENKLFYFSEIRAGNLSLPELSRPALDVLAFVTYQALQAYCSSLGVCRAAITEYGLQMHLHKMMMFLATCCPSQEVLGAVEAVGYLSNSVRVEGAEPAAARPAVAALLVPPTFSRADHGTAAAAPGPRAAAAPGEGSTGRQGGLHNQHSDMQHGTKLETEELVRADPLAGRIEIVVRLVYSACT